MARPMTKRERDTISTAYHEAGHAVVAVALGMPVESVWITGERSAVGRVLGTTQVDPIWLHESTPSLQDALLQGLAGDAVDARRGVFDGAHVLLAHERFGEEIFREAWTETQRLVADHWSEIERVATALLADPNHDLYGDEVNRVMRGEDRPEPSGHE